MPSLQKVQVGGVWKLLKKQVGGVWKLVKECCCGGACTPLCGSGLDSACGFCDQCGPIKATLRFNLASLNGCYATPDGKWLRLQFTNEAANFCLTGSGCNLSFGVTFGVTDGFPFGTSSSCLGDHRVYSDSGCSTRVGGGPYAVGVSFSVSKISRTEWNFTASVFGTTIINDTWTVTDGSCDPSRSAASYAITACSCPESPVTPTGSCFLVSFNGGAPTGCAFDSDRYAKMLDCGGGSFNTCTSSMAVNGNSDCSFTGTAPIAKGGVYNNEDCTASAYPTCCERTNTNVSGGRSTVSCTTPTLYRWRGTVHQGGSGCNAMNPGGLVCGTAYTTDPNQSVTINGSGSDCNTPKGWCDAGGLTITPL